MKKRSARKSAPAAAKKLKKLKKPKSPVPAIVGIGASAGGLEAFTRLLRNLAPDTGLAYVLVQHLAREHESLLAELLGRASTIPVVQARDGIRVEADHAYVIPPDTTMTVTDGHLRLVQRPTDGGIHLPVDAFLTSLADVHGPGAIAVILSGAGSDGARGVEAVKEAGGIIFAQDTASAKHASMPEAAVATGTVDFVLPPEKVAAQLTRIGRYLAEARGPLAAVDRVAAEEADLLAVLKLLQRRTNVDFSEYRRGTVDRRILRRMLVNRQESRADYLKLVRHNPAELDLLYQDLLIGVTSFFRDPEVFAELRTTAFPALAKSRRPNAPFRVWVAGCSGGEETYSLAIALIEFFEESGIEVPLQLFGTDLSDMAVARARIGVYSEGIAQNVSPERLRRFFVPELNGYRIAKFVRDVCIFSRQNIVRDPPFSHLDLISCRNVLIYFDPALQRRVLPIFHYALEPHGMLLLGTAESPGTSELFEPIDKRHKIYRRRETAHGSTLDFLNYKALADGAASATVSKLVPSPRPPAAGDATVDAEIDRLVLAHFGRCGVVVNARGTITSFRGDTTPFLAHGSGSATLDVFRLARPDLAPPLRAALKRATTDRQFARERLAMTTPAGERQVTIEVFPLPSASPASQTFLVLFNEDTLTTRGRPRAKSNGAKVAPRRTRTKLSELEAVREELASAKAYLGEVVEQHAATVEELRAAGEEIQSSNEELQSTNEELETAKEEVQSTNEELSTLNEELQNRNRELGELASDLSNVLTSTTMPIVIVDHELRLRRFTPATTRVMKVIPSDIGRPLSDIKLCFDLPDVGARIAESTRTLAASRHIVKDDSGCWWALTIRPYQTVDRRVDGAVLVFVDAAEESEDRRLAVEAAETARVLAVRDAKALSAGVVARERAEADRNSLLRQLDSAQEDERRRLSRELHDEIGQHLTALNLGLHALSRVTPPGSEVDRRAEELRLLVGRLGLDLHTIAIRLRPRILDDFGLEPAIESLAAEWSKQCGVPVAVHTPAESQRLSAAVEGAVYRVVQEALNNVAKHAQANNAGISVERRDGQLHVIVEDDGKGFDYHPVSRPPAAGAGLGLLGIRERLALLGGSLEIETAPGHGTTLYIRVPVDA